MDFIKFLQQRHPIIVLVFHANDAPDRLPFQHVVKGLVNLREGHGVSDELLQF